MPEIPQPTPMRLPLSGAALQAQDIAPGAHREVYEGVTSSATLCYPAQACQSQAKDLSGGYEATDGVLRPAFETHDEMNTRGNQPITDRDYYDTIQKPLQNASTMLIDILSEIRQLQLRLTALEQALSNLWYQQQAPYWECTSDNAEFLVPPFINMQGQNYYNPTWPTQSDIFCSDGTRTQE